MNEIPSYGKILTLGSAFTENALKGDVIIQEKVDGSQFAFGIDDDGVLLCQSKGQNISLEVPPKLFKGAVEHVIKLADSAIFQDVPNGSYFYGEVLQTPKHKCLVYSKVPTNHIVLFDAVIGGTYLDYPSLVEVAKEFEIDVVPLLFEGEADLEKVTSLLTTQSYLGGETIEGVVIKNYKEFISLNGQTYPLFTKYVRDSFKERNKVNWDKMSPKSNVTSVINSYKTEARWLKAIQNFRDSDKLEQAPKDIGPLIKQIHNDILTEETENIKNQLFKIYSDDILRVSVSGFPDFYKRHLSENIHA